MSITVPAIRRALYLFPSATWALLFCCSLALAQADAPQFKTQSISAFGGYLYDHIDYSGGYNDGVMFGMDFTQHIRFPVQPSLEARVNLAPGDDITEHSYVFGPVLSARLGHVTPYGDFLIGLGTIHFNHPADTTYTHDNSTVYGGGGGLEIDLIHNLRVRFDMQYQHWNLGKTPATAFTPVLAGAGIAYTIPFRAFHRHSDPHY